MLIWRLARVNAFESRFPRFKICNRRFSNVRPMVLVVLHRGHRFWLRYALPTLSAVAHAVLCLVVGAAQAHVPAPPVPTPAPRPVAAPTSPKRPLPARPIAIVTTGLGTLALASGLSLVAIGVQSRVIAPDGRTEGEALGRRVGSTRLLAVAIPLTVVGVVAVIGGIVWIVRDRRRAQASHRQ